MADFNIAVELVLSNEGGYVHNLADSGGETAFGISKRSYPSIDPKTLTIEQAKAIYKRDFWHPLYAELRSQEVANKLMDMSVNFGQGNSTIIVQKALRGLGCAIKQDGVFGRNTLAIVNQTDAQTLLTAIRKHQAMRYVAIVQKNPSQIAFLEGWLRRVFSC